METVNTSAKHTGSVFLVVVLVVYVFVSASAPVRAQVLPANIQWPFTQELHDGIFVQMHPDTDRKTGSMRDYRCGTQYVYDGHRGTDLTLFNFRLMDQGVAVYAAASGTVFWTRDGAFDRNYWPPYVGDPNAIILQHGGITNSQYWHLRKNSIAVAAGESVKAGDFIAFIGASGSSPLPHLHFELWEPQNGTNMYRDPFNGACQGMGNLWADPPAYPGDTQLRLLDFDIFIDENLLGAENNNFFGDRRLKDRPLRPRVLSNTQIRLGVWLQFQGDANAWFTVKIYRPNGSVFSNTTRSLEWERSVNWKVEYHTFAAAVSESDKGFWRLSVEYAGVEIGSKTFEVGNETSYSPRFFPISGRSFQLDGVEKRDTLRVSGGSGALTYELVNAPSFVSLSDGYVTIKGGEHTDGRNTYFDVRVTDERGDSDLMKYHLVDMTRTVGTVSTAIVSPDILIGSTGSTPFSLSSYPNPFSSETTVRFTLDRPSTVRLVVFDLLGRQVLELVEPQLSVGVHERALDLSGLPPAIYIVRIESGSRMESSRLVKSN